MKVEKNIPVPRKYPFADMQVGDSFAVPPSVKRSAVTIAAKRYAHEHGMKFTVRQMPDKSLRCWRLE